MIDDFLIFIGVITRIFFWISAFACLKYFIYDIIETPLSSLTIKDIGSLFIYFSIILIFFEINRGTDVVNEPFIPHENWGIIGILLLFFGTIVINYNHEWLKFFLNLYIKAFSF